MYELRHDKIAKLMNYTQVTWVSSGWMQTYYHSSVGQHTAGKASYIHFPFHTHDLSKIKFGLRLPNQDNFHLKTLSDDIFFKKIHALHSLKVKKDGFKFLHC